MHINEKRFVLKLFFQALGLVVLSFVLCQTAAAQLQVVITSPLPDETISRQNTMVQGTVTNNVSDNQTGVVVNGVTALVYGNQWVANKVPLLEGENIITAVAYDLSGDNTTTSVSVTADTSVEYIDLYTEATGVSDQEIWMTMKIDVYFNPNDTIPPAELFSDSGPGPITVGPAYIEDNYIGHMLFDCSEGDVVNEGIYYFTVEVQKIVPTCSGDEIYYFTDTFAVLVRNPQALEGELRQIWTNMTGALGSGDTVTAANYMFEPCRDKYHELYDVLLEQLPAIMSTFTEFNFIRENDLFAKFELVVLEDTKLYSYEITFIKDQQGFWRIGPY